MPPRARNHVVTRRAPPRGATISVGRYLRYPEETPLANLQLTILEKFGLPVEQFGDSNGRLATLTGV